MVVRKQSLQWVNEHFEQSFSTEVVERWLFTSKLQYLMSDTLDPNCGEQSAFAADWLNNGCEKAEFTVGK